jgi:tetratricopeptide (TPR) repeat protein
VPAARARSLAVLTAATLIAANLAANLAAAAPPERAGRTRPDPDDVAEQHSVFWEEIVHPGAALTRVNLDDAIRLLRVSTGDLGRAAELLATVTRDTPDDPDGWGYLAITAERLRRWSVCAEAYARTWRLDPTWRPLRLIDGRPSPRSPLGRPLAMATALCQSRGGDLDGAAATLAAVIARGEATGDTWLRAGEVAMAQGRLVDAIDALERAGAELGARWMLAVAFDRARRDAEAQAVAELAQREDNSATRSSAFGMPAIQPGDTEYLLAFAAERGGRPEFAIAYYRRYLAVAPADLPWRARAAAPLEALGRTDLASQATVESASASAADRTAAIAAVRAAMPAISACMAPIPTGLHELRVAVAAPPERKPSPFERGGRPPRTPAPAPPQPRDRHHQRRVGLPADRPAAQRRARRHRGRAPLPRGGRRPHAPPTYPARRLAPPHPRPRSPVGDRRRSQVAPEIASLTLG